MARPLASAEAREQRINQLLDAAVTLWLQHPERVPSVAEVADEAGLAKGTVYLYFKSKEDYEPRGRALESLRARQ